MALGTYNRTPANRSGGSQLFEAKYELTGALSAVMGAGVTYQARADFAGVMDAEIEPRFGFDEYYAMAGTCQMDIALQAVIMPRIAMADALTFTAEPIQTERYAMTGQMTSTFALWRQIHITQNMGATLAAYFSGMQTVEHTMTFANLVIPPGGVLILDSEYFTTLLNGENVIDQYEGEWLEITHKLQGIDVSSATSGTIAVSLLYRERYL